MRPFAVLLLTALPAAGHDGAHLHPHGSGSWLVAVGGLAVIAAAGVLGRRLSRVEG